MTPCPRQSSDQSSTRWDLRGQLRVVDQVFQWVAAAELVQQARQVADDGGGVGRVDVPWNVADLHQWQVPVSVGSLRCGDLEEGRTSGWASLSHCGGHTEGGLIPLSAVTHCINPSLILCLIREETPQGMSCCSTLLGTGLKTHGCETERRLAEQKKNLF